MTLTAPRLGAIAIVLRGDSVLLAKRSKAPDAGLWGFPGGHVELGETALAAAGRELREETGVTAVPVEYLTNIDVLRKDADGTLTVHYLLAVVLCDYVDGTPCAADDVMDADWVPLDEVRTGLRPMSERVEALLDMALVRAQARRAAARA
jgi:ADP-ribose pyrophosphatase YjhB (NUDIX family)